MGELIDARPDRFLREMREYGSWDEACKRSGMTQLEVEQLCFKNPKFDLAQVECQLEYAEDKLTQATESAVEQARQNLKNKLAELRASAMSLYRERHNSPEETTNGGQDC